MTCRGGTIQHANRVCLTGEPEEDQHELTDADYDEVDTEYHTWYDEPLSGLRALSHQARATIRLARRLHDGQSGAKADWDALPFLPELISKAIVPVHPDPFASLEDYPSKAELTQLGIDDGRAASSNNSPGANDDSGETADPEPADAQYRRQVQALGQYRLVTSQEFQRRILGDILNYLAGACRCSAAT